MINRFKIQDSGFKIQEFKGFESLRSLFRKHRKTRKGRKELEQKHRKPLLMFVTLAESVC